VSKLPHAAVYHTVYATYATLRCIAATQELTLHTLLIVKETGDIAR